MARSFDGSNDDLGVASAVVSTTPFTMACWFKTNGTPAANQILMKLYNSGVDNLHRHQLYVDASLRVRVETVDGTSGNNINATAFFTASAWQHACGVWSSATSRTAYLNGTDAQTNTSSRTPSGLDATVIGAGIDTVPGGFFNGAIMEAAIWNLALTAQEVEMLGTPGVMQCPLSIRPSALVAYWPLIGVDSPEPDRVGGFNTTVTGATEADHGRIRYPAKSSNPGFNGTFAVGPGGGRNVFAIPG